MNQNYYSYEDIIKMQEHAKKYSGESDKRNFLKEVSIVEQKMVLLSNQRPYEVLIYLDSLNNKETNKMLNELTNEEISNIILLFTDDDKKNFYSNFSQTSLVNRFIAMDKNAFQHIEHLELDRKIELLDSSKSYTENASKKLYESISEDDKQYVSDSLTTAEASVVLDNVSSDFELNNEISNIEEKQEEFENKEMLIEKPEPAQKEQPQEQQVLEENPKLDNELKEMNDFLKTKLQHYIENDPRFKDLDINNPKLYESLTPELRDVVDNDFNQLKNENKNPVLAENSDDKNIEDQEKLNSFNELKSACENEVIEQVKAIAQEKMVAEESVKTM